jgi:hypothetical protein
MLVRAACCGVMHTRAEMLSALGSEAPFLAFSSWDHTSFVLDVGGRQGEE